MTIVDKIIGSIKAALGDDFPVYYHDEATLNLKTQTMQFPCALFYLLTVGTAEAEGGQMKERVTAAVFFVEPSQYDFNAVENETIIDRCKGRCFAWLLSLNGSEEIGLHLINRTNRVYDKFDDILTGFGVSVDLKELKGECI